MNYEWNSIFSFFFGFNIHNITKNKLKNYPPFGFSRKSRKVETEGNE